jgi:uncharacterized damage-inducible protein DinB
MSPAIKQHFILEPKGYRDTESGLFMAQFDELSRNMWADLPDIKPAELAWQPAPGMNTIGMLLAHMAVVEVFWIQRTGKGFDAAGLHKVLGIGVDDDGMPCPAGGAPPAALKGWTIADYLALHGKARAFAKRAAKKLTATDLERTIDVKRRDGSRMRLNVRWILHHLLEHFAGHYGQVLMLRHQYRDRRKKR